MEIKRNQKRNQKKIKILKFKRCKKNTIYCFYTKKKISNYIIIMIITLNSTNKFNYQFTNDFNETLTLKADSIIKVKNINVTKKFSVEITDDNRSFTLIFDEATNPPFIFTIPSGFYTLSELETALNNAYDSDIYGYDLRFVIESNDFVDKAGIVKLIVSQYLPPTSTATNPYQAIAWSVPLQEEDDTQQAASILSKTSATSDLDDNYFLYKGYLDSTNAPTGQVSADFPPRPAGLKRGTIKFNTSFTGATSTDVSFALVQHDWDLSYDSAKEFLRVDIVGERKLIRIYQDGTEIVDYTAELTTGRGISLKDDRFLVVRMYQPPGTMTDDQKKYYSHFSIWTETSGSKRIIKNLYQDANVANMYDLDGSEMFYPVWFFLDNTTRVQNATANINTANEENYNVVKSKINPEFEVNAQAVITLDGTNQIITSNDPLPSNNSCGANTQRVFHTGHVVFSMQNNNKAQSVGFGMTKTLLESALTYGFRFNSDGNIYKIKEGVVDASVLTTYNTTNYYKLSITSGNPILETSVDSGVTWTMLNIDSNLSVDTAGEGMYFNVIFESQLGSAGTYVKIYEEATHNQYHVGATGDFLQFEPTDLRQTLGFSQLIYAMDFSADPYFPQEAVAESEMRFENRTTTFKKSFRIQARNLPVKSYNGATGNSDFTIATLDIDREGNVSYPIEQISECLNKYDMPLNEIQIEITDDTNTLAVRDFSGDSQITLEISPHLSI